MPKVIELNESVKQMTLNADNRRAFVNAILKDVLQARSDTVRKEMAQLQDKLVERTWGTTPQARTAVKKTASKLEESAKALRAKGFHVSGVMVGSATDKLSLNIGGRSVNLYWHEELCGASVINFNQEFITCCNYRNEHARLVSSKCVRLGNSELTLQQNDPLTVQFWKLKDEADAIKEAGEQLTAILNSVLGKAKKLGQALEKWPELSQYAPAILSACREITVHPDVLNKILDGLADGKQPVGKVMKAAETV